MLAPQEGFEPSSLASMGRTDGHGHRVSDSLKSPQPERSLDKPRTQVIGLQILPRRLSPPLVNISRVFVILNY